MSGHHVQTSKSLKVGFRKHGFNPKLAWDIVETYYNASFLSEILWTSWNIWFLENVGNIMAGHQKWISARRRVFNFVALIFVIPIFLSPIMVCLSESKAVNFFLIHTLFFEKCDFIMSGHLCSTKNKSWNSKNMVSPVIKNEIIYSLEVSQE